MCSTAGVSGACAVFFFVIFPYYIHDGYMSSPIEWQAGRTPSPLADYLERAEHDLLEFWRSTRGASSPQKEPSSPGASENLKAMRTPCLLWRTQATFPALCRGGDRYANTSVTLRS